MTERAYIHALCNPGKLSPGDQQKLILAWRQDGDCKARARVILAYMPLVVKLAMKFHRQDSSLGDLINEGAEGLIRAVDTFDLNGNSPLSTYAWIWARARITRYIYRGAAPVSVSEGITAKRVYYNLVRAKQRLGIIRTDLTQGDITRLAKYMFCSESEISAIVNSMNHSLSMEMNVRVDKAGGAEIKLVDTLPSSDPSPYDILEELDMKIAKWRSFSEALATLKPRNQEIMRRTMQEESQVDIAADFGTSRQNISLICARSIARITQHVKDNAVL